jgi:hypothetical protein
MYFLNWYNRFFNWLLNWNRFFNNKYLFLNDRLFDNRIMNRLRNRN